MAKPKIFVSHSALDTAFALKLVNDLNAAGAQAWMDVNDLGAGNFQQRISQALAECEWFLVVLTRNALASDWVIQEVDAANQLKHQKRIKELIFVKAAAVDYSELPALWGAFNIFDGTEDYNSARDRSLKTIGLQTETTRTTAVSAIDTEHQNHHELFLSSSEVQRRKRREERIQRRLDIAQRQVKSKAFRSALGSFDWALEEDSFNWVALSGKITALLALGRRQDADSLLNEISAQVWTLDDEHITEAFEVWYSNELHRIHS